MGGEPQVKLDLVSAEKNTLRVEMKELKERLRDTESSRCAPKPSSPLVAERRTRRLSAALLPSAYAAVHRSRRVCARSLSCAADSVSGAKSRARPVGVVLSIARQTDG